MRRERKSAIEKNVKEWEKMSKAPNGRPATSQSGGGKASSLDIPDMHTGAIRMSHSLTMLPLKRNNHLLTSASVPQRNLSGKIQRQRMRQRKPRMLMSCSKSLKQLHLIPSYGLSYLWICSLRNIRNQRNANLRLASRNFEITNFGKRCKP